MIYKFEDIIHLHLEISSRCNAACPLCPRTFWGYPLNQGYVEHDMTLDEAKKIFSKKFLMQLKNIVINGNFGDAVMNPDTVDICRYFKESNPDIKINISTNGGARDQDFWIDLAKAGIEVFFCIDGLEDTHSIYRRNTVFSTVIKNAKTFINAGGAAGWKMIKFEHNIHQVEECRKMSQDIGFNIFLLVDDGRDNGPVFNKKKELVFTLGPSKWQGDSGFEFLYRGNFDTNLQESAHQNLLKHISIKEIQCEVSLSKSIYVSSTGDVFPCCYTGFSPGTYKSNNDVGLGMQQISKIMYDNNALKNGLEQCISWFDRIEDSWQKPSFIEGRLITCNQSCGGKPKIDTFHVKDAQMTDHRYE